MRIEVCANSLQSALNAEIGGAHRIELCSELGVGGITPSQGCLKLARESVSIPIHVLIRPRSGNFTYNGAELDMMLEDIALCRDLGMAGVVTGVLHGDNTLDLTRTSLLREAAKDMHFTFHRAFDWVPDPKTTFQALEDLGVDTVLSSGQMASAPEGISLLKELHRSAGRTTVMPGGGIRPDNMGLFLKAGFRYVHLSGIRRVLGQGSPPKVTMNSPGLLTDTDVFETDTRTIGHIVELANGRAK